MPHVQAGMLCKGAAPAYRQDLVCNFNPTQLKQKPYSTRTEASLVGIQNETQMIWLASLQLGLLTQATQATCLQ